MENDDVVVQDDSLNESGYDDFVEIVTQPAESEESEVSEESEESEVSEESEESEVSEEFEVSEDIESQKEVNHETKSESSTAYSLADPIDYSDKFEAIEKSLNLNTASLIALVLLFGLLKGLKKI